MITPNHLQRPLAELLAELEAAVGRGDRVRALQLEQTILQRLATEAVEHGAVERRVRELIKQLDQPAAAPHVGSTGSFDIKGIIERGREGAGAELSAREIIYPVWFATNV